MLPPKRVTDHEPRPAAGLRSQKLLGPDADDGGRVPVNAQRFPMMAGSEPRCCRQNRSLITTAGARPGCSYVWSKKRPNDGRTPSVEKYEGVTSCPQVLSVRPPLETPKGTGATYAKVDENRSPNSR